MQLAPLRPRRRRYPVEPSADMHAVISPSRRPADLAVIAERIAGLNDGPVSDALVGMLTELYGDALSRIVQAIQEAPDGAALMARMCADRLVGGLFVIHDLHPEPLAARIERALATLTASASLERIDDDVVYVRLARAMDTAECNAIALAIAGAAPEIARVCAQVGVEERFALS